MLNPRRLPSSATLLRLFSPINTTPSLRPIIPLCCIRFESRWTPGYPPPRPRPRQRIITVPEDPKDYLEGWPEYKESLLRRAKTPEEIQIINELSPEEARFLMDPELYTRDTEEIPIIKRMPANTNYFSGSPVIEQRLQDVEKIVEKYKHLPRAPQHLCPQRDWKNVAIANSEDLDSQAGSTEKRGIKGSYSRRIIAMGKELNRIHPVLMPPELKTWLDNFAPLRQDGVAGSRQKRKLDRFERSRGHARRKTARAKVQVVPGEGQIYVNGKLASEYFTRSKDVENIIWPLQCLSAVGKYNVWVSTFGGGTTGQSEACKVAVARAMLAHDKSGELNMFRRILRKG